MSSILFIGSRNNFPDCLLRLVDNEIEGSTPSRVTTLEEFLELTGSDRPPQLVILEDSLCSQIDSQSFKSLFEKRKVSVAIAFRHGHHLPQAYVFRTDHAGGLSYLPMDLNVEIWLGIVRLLLTGCILIPSDLKAARTGEQTPDPMASERDESEAIALGKLTPRERDVLALVAQGMQNKRIAGQLQLSEHTVKLHLHHVISKLGARNRTEAALRFKRYGPM